MTCAPLLPSLSCLLWVPLLSCATAPGISAASLSQDPAEPFEPIRFGDDAAHTYPHRLLPGSDYDPSFPTPDALLGQPWGSRLASHDEILAALTTWAEASPRATLARYGQTFEGRPLVRLVITSAENQARLREIQDGLLTLSDPRGLSESDGRRLVEGSPAMAWMGYSIHGDETSGADCAPLLAYHLIACRDADVSALLNDVVVVLDPCLNPDGRERIRAMTRWNSGYQGNLDGASLHRGRWPHGRGNHYLFDMNRDWMAGVCPETRGRWSVLREFKPQLFVDAHEMAADDTFLFYPQSKPHNPQLSQKIIEWQGRLADDVARAFDERGWAYYTREWADAWYPGYSDAWGSLNGAIGMLYEQAGLGGQALRRASGRVVTYRESVHHQLVASLSNLASLAANRAAILADYLDQRRHSVDATRPGAERAFAFQDTHPDRTRRFLESMLGQDIEVWRTDGESQAQQVVRANGERSASETLPAGTYLIPSLQPQARLVHAYLDFDPRIDEETVLDERERLERGQRSRLYDVTAWDLARQLDLDALWCTPADGPRTRVQNVPAAPGRVRAPAGARPYAWAVDAADDRCLAFAARALDLGLQVHAADREFQFSVTEDGQQRTLELGRGSLLLRRHENPEDVDELLERAALASGVQVWATGTGRATGEDPDLGGQHFQLLARPRVALLSGNPVSSSD
ncbi:MAG: M14 family zinc carboxypeptidase, partial [Planctomycetota bacterium]